MPAARARIIADLLEEHLEELDFLWNQRQGVLASPALTKREISDLDQRINAHVEGLLVGEEQTIPVVKESLAAEDSAVTFAAAYTLLRLQNPVAARIVSEAFRQAQEGQLEGVRQALCHGPIELILEDVYQAAETAAAPIAVAAIEALAYHSRINLESKRLEQFLTDENAEVRLAAWRISGEINVAPNQRAFDAGLGDKEARVRREALWAAAWTRQSWLPGHCRSLCANPVLENGDAFMLLAILGKPEDLQRVQGLGRCAALGPKRFQILGAYGHPEVVEDLIRGMESADLRSAVAAGAAFTKITGCDIESDKRVQLPPEDGHEPDEFEKEFLDEAKLPDAQRARAQWQGLKEKFAKGTRWCRGFDLSQGTKPEILDQLDMESRREACLRGKFEGSWGGTPIELERFPHVK